jgi:hypothetical protein
MTPPEPAFVTAPAPPDPAEPVIAPPAPPLVLGVSLLSPELQPTSVTADTNAAATSAVPPVARPLPVGAKAFDSTSVPVSVATT